MRLLKRKVKLVQDAKEDCNDFLEALDVKTETSSTETTETTETAETDSKPINTTEFILPMRKPRQKPSSPNGNSKNIVKNYGKALCAFASSDVAVPYLENLISRNNWLFVKVPAFIGYIKSKKDAINSIESLRRLLIPDIVDSQEILVYKRLFQEVAIIFLKYFAVNWIFGGRLMHKSAHMKFRFKMLRRIQDPEHFTYLKTAVK